MDINYVKRRGDSTDRELHIDAVRYFANHLLPDHHLIINLTLLHKFKHYGDCEHLTGNTFSIRINQNQTSEQIVTTIAHEMIHVKQYYNGELKATDKAIVWKDKYYYNDYKKCEPWEVETTEMEHVLTMKFYNYRLTKHKHVV